MDMFEASTLMDDLFSGLVQLERKRQGLSCAYDNLSTACNTLRDYLAKYRKRKTYDERYWPIVDAMSELSGSKVAGRSRVTIWRRHKFLRSYLVRLETLIKDDSMTNEGLEELVNFACVVLRHMREHEREVRERRRPHDPYKKYATT